MLAFLPLPSPIPSPPERVIATPAKEGSTQGPFMVNLTVEEGYQHLHVTQDAQALAGNRLHGIRSPGPLQVALGGEGHTKQYAASSRATGSALSTSVPATA